MIEVHPKIWGEERWIVNREYCGKILVVKRGGRCSTHYHKLKDETFFVQKGLILLEHEGVKLVLKPGDSRHIPVGSKHRFTGLEDSEILEFSTHHEDSDSYRETVGGLVDEDDLNRLIKDALSKTLS